MPPEMNIVPLTAGWSGQLLPSLVNMSGPLMGVRSSTGSLRSRHVSRDSGDYLIDTPNSGEDGLHTGAGIQGVNAKELHSALQGHQQHSLTHADIALILLAEIAYENDEDFREHLPLLFHVTFVSMDSSEDIVLEHCQHLLVNLLYSLAGRHLELYEVENSDGENKQQVVSLIKYVQSKRGSMRTPQLYELSFQVLLCCRPLSRAWWMLYSFKEIYGKLGEQRHLNGQWSAHQDTSPAGPTKFIVHFGPA